MEFTHDLQIVFVIEFVARQNAELVAGPEQRDWNHQGAGKLEGMVLRKQKIGDHLRLHLWSGPFPLDGSRQCPEPVAITAKARAEAAAACLADPVSGLIDGDPGLDQEAIHQEREWDASTDLPPANKDRADADLVALLDTGCYLLFAPVIRSKSMPTSAGYGSHRT